jgi:TRAP-type C4-dicarboxylate transport system permease small subunit
VNRPPTSSRKYLRIALGVFIAAILTIIIVTTWQYWTRERTPTVEQSAVQTQP